MPYKYQKGFIPVIILFIVILLIAVIGLGGAYYLKPKKQDSVPTQTIQPETVASPSSFIVYKNFKYEYQIGYPPIFAIKENNDKSGVGFIPDGKTGELGDQAIWVTVRHKTGDMETSKTPLAEYAKTAATQEIQNYDELASITTVTTNSGQVGYKTTWKRSPPPIVGGSHEGSNEPSLPITYFELPSDPYYTIQVYLDDEKYLPEYEQMLKTFSAN